MFVYVKRTKENFIGGGTYLIKKYKYVSITCRDWLKKKYNRFLKRSGIRRNRTLLVDGSKLKTKY